ncbi:glycoside hydrolase [Choiromyces venosus 120613-1]|uniref:Probable beta-glucosidase G n=1 Tax=Choiromyces venosus 120613-1 TaxID=1336337 RepID=A0A3N4JQD4_9PEZI|nr:glycoside hydrolase [Choiromyces venosus 120613-1]
MARTLVLTLSVLYPAAVVAGEHDHIAAQFGQKVIPRTWDQSYILAKTFVDQLTTAEKVVLTTGTGISLGLCSGNTDDIPRLGFWELCLQDGPVGGRGTDKVSVFPAGVTVGATWDRELMYLRSRAMGVENRLKGVNVALAPVAGALGRLMSAPAVAGRGWEGFGPDPYLAGVGNAESIKGLQDEGVITCAKHWIGSERGYRFALENPPNLDRPIFQSISSQIDGRALQEAGDGRVRCSYQRVNGEYTCESTDLLRNHLKGNTAGGLGFRGFTMTDWLAAADAGEPSTAGIDMIMPGDLGLAGKATALKPASDGALQNGTRLDEMATRVIASWHKMQQDEGLISNISFSTWNADDTATLLKNVNNALPLKNVTSMGVFGNGAGPIPADSCGTFQSCSRGTLALGWGSGSGNFDYLVDVIESALGDYAYAEMRQKAAGKDVCLAFINSLSGENTNAVEGNFDDRNNTTAWRDGDTLISNIASTCKNTIAVIHSVGPILMEPRIDHRTLRLGRRNTAAGYSTLGRAYSPSRSFRGGPLLNYKWFDAKGVTPRFEFGFGLSYAAFSYATTLSIPSPKSPVTQLYITLPSSTNSPVRQLREFVKLSLNPGESKVATFRVTKRDISYWDTGRGVACASSRDSKATRSVSF